MQQLLRLDPETEMTRLGFHCHGLDHFDKVILSNGLKRGEFYNFVPQSLPDLRKEIRRHNLASSIHAPLTRILLCLFSVILTWKRDSSA